MDVDLDSRDGDPVFVDRSGQRRRLVTIAGAGLGTTLVIGCLVLVAGLTGGSPVPLPGSPGSGPAQHNPENAVVLPAAVPTAGPAASTAKRSPSPRVAVTGAVGATTPAMMPSASPTAQPGNRRTNHPGNPKASRTK